MLQTAGVTPPMTKQAIEVIARNARLQSQLIEDILDVSRIITGKLEIEHVPVSVHQFLETAAAGIAPAEAAANHRLEPRFRRRCRRSGRPEAPPAGAEQRAGERHQVHEGGTVVLMAGRELDGVRQHVVEHLVQPFRIALDRRQVRRECAGWS